MINLIIQLAISQEWHGVSKSVDLAKGGNQYITTYKQFWKVIKREYYSWRKISNIR